MIFKPSLTSELNLREAQLEDSAQLSAFFASIPTLGAIDIKIQREDHFFSFYHRLGLPHKTFILENKEEILGLYDKYANEAKALMERKNHDYGEAWRDMRISSITDLIYQKVLRTKQIEDNQGKTIVSEGLDANYFDMLNYAVFCLIKFSEKENQFEPKNI